MDKKENVILIVDDEVELSNLIKEVLILDDFNVLQAISGNEAFELIQNNDKISLVFSDIRMKNGNGIELVKRVEKEISNPPIVYLISGFASYTEEEVLESGAKAFLAKPYDVATISDIAKKHFKKAS